MCFWNKVNSKQSSRRNHQAIYKYEDHSTALLHHNLLLKTKKWRIRTKKQLQRRGKSFHTRYPWCLNVRTNLSELEIGIGLQNFLPKRMERKREFLWNRISTIISYSWWACPCLPRNGPRLRANSIARGEGPTDMTWHILILPDEISFCSFSLSFRCSINIPVHSTRS